MTISETAYCPRCKLNRPTDGSMEQCKNEFCAEPYKDILDGHGNTVIVSRDPIPGFWQD